MYDYLTKVLGFVGEFHARGPDGGMMFAGAHAESRGQRFTFVLGDIHEALHGHYDHGDFGKQMEAHPNGTGVVLYFFVPDVDKKYGELVARGAQIDEPPTDQFWGHRCISVLSPEGYYFTFATPIKGFEFPPAFAARIEWEKGAQENQSKKRTRPSKKKRKR